MANHYALTDEERALLWKVFDRVKELDAEKRLYSTANMAEKLECGVNTIQREKWRWYHSRKTPTSY